MAVRLQMAMSKLDLQNPDDLRKLISIQMATGDRTGAAKTAAMLQAVETKQKLPFRFYASKLDLAIRSNA